MDLKERFREFIEINVDRPDRVLADLLWHYYLKHGLTQTRVFLEWNDYHELADKVRDYIWKYPLPKTDWDDDPDLIACPVCLKSIDMVLALDGWPDGETFDNHQVICGHCNTELYLSHFREESYRISTQEIY